MKAAILTWGSKGRELYRLLAGDSSGPIQVRCVVDSDCSLWGAIDGGKAEVVSSGKAAELYKNAEIDKFIIPSVKESIIDALLPALAWHGIPADDLLYASIEIFRDAELSACEKTSRICPFGEHRELNVMELHVTDHCNLNCKNCTMFAALVKEPVFVDVQSTIRDLHQLRRFFDHVKIFRVLGGEPLLHPNLNQILDAIRSIFPYSIIRLLTNGLLVKGMNDQLLASIKANDVTVHISQYQVASRQIDSINRFLAERAIRHEITPIITHFQKMYDASGKAEMNFSFESCPWRKRGCETMHDGKIAACFVPFAIPYLSNHFGLDIPASGMIDLYDGQMTTKRMRELLNQPFETCRYCASSGHVAPWELSDEQTKNELSSWSI